MNYWSVPRMFEGRTIAVLASGPSMSQAVADKIHAAGVPAIVVNNTFRLAPWASILVANDLEWWRATDDWKDFAGFRVCSQPGRAIEGVQRLRVTADFGFDPDPSCIRFGSNSGYQAVHIGIQTGASRILLCGFDMHGGHWHGPHKEPLRNPQPHRFARWIKRFRDLRDQGSEIVNCTPGSKLDCFPMADLEDVLTRGAE